MRRSRKVFFYKLELKAELKTEALDKVKVKAGRSKLNPYSAKPQIHQKTIGNESSLLHLSYIAP